MSIEKTWNEKSKSRNDLFWRHHRNKRLEELCNSELNYSSKFPTKLQLKETPEEKKIMQNLTKEKVRPELQLEKIIYGRQLESVKEIDNEMTNLIKSKFSGKLQYSWKNNGLNNVKQESLHPYRSF